MLKKRISSPWEIQKFISTISYNPGYDCKSAARTVKVRTAHCMEGALLAAALLEPLGHEPSLLHFRAHRDDDHVVALFRENSAWGAIGKSNTTLLTWRPPMYRSVEALLMSYWPFYFNTRGQMSLCAWAGPVRLKRYDSWNWRESDQDISELSESFYDRERERAILTPAQIEKLPIADKRLVSACFLGANPKGLFRA